MPWRFLDAGGLSVRSVVFAGVQKPAQLQTWRSLKWPLENFCLRRLDSMGRMRQLNAAFGQNSTALSNIVNAASPDRKLNGDARPMIKFLKHRGLSKFVGLLAVALVARQGFAQKPDAQQATTLITNVRIFDGKSPTLSEPINVLVRGNLIEKISKDRVPADRNAGMTVLDGRGGTLMPGLIGAHYHMLMSTIPPSLLMTADSTYTMLRSSKAAGEVLMRGFTSVRDVGGPAFGLKRAIDEGIASGPRIWPSGVSLSMAIEGTSRDY